jgi:thymidylate kinase
VHANLTERLTAYQVIVLEGCDGTGKTILAGILRDRHGYNIIHSGRTPDGTDLTDRYRQILATPGKVVLDRSFVSELVYGPLFHDWSRVAVPDAIDLARRAAARGGVFVHLTGDADVIAARLRSRDGTAPPLERLRAIIDAYHNSFRLLADAAPVITAEAGPGSA